VEGLRVYPIDPSWAAILTDPVRLSVVRALCQLQTATTAELRVLSHTSDPTLRRHLEALEALGLICELLGERDGTTPGRPARRFSLDGDAAARLRTVFELLSEPLVTTPGPARQPPADR
jgi:DNA-binding transcriptional ArsR family regulator